MLFFSLNRSLDLSPNIGGGHINRIYSRRAIKAGLDESEIKGIGSHLMRVGTAQDSLNSEASMPIIVQRRSCSNTDAEMRCEEHLIARLEKAYFLELLKYITVLAHRYETYSFHYLI
jgi:hypothetical protein